jgi:ParB/RepB/Spo0J family partition protein
MSEKPKPTTRDAIRNAVQRRREPPSDLREPPRGLIQQPSNDQEVPSWASEQTMPSAQSTAEQGDHGSRITIVPINKIRPGRYQKRETVDPEKYQQLKDQIRELGFQFVAVLCPDPDDSAYYNLMMGGHLRIQAASELGITEVSAIIREYDRVALAKGTYFENNGRQSLTPMEEGLIFQQCMNDEGWTQQEVAEKLIVSGGQSYISFCINAAMAAPDLQEMLRKEPGRGRRCFSYLLRLDALGQEKALKLREPIIRDFLDGKVTTDEVEVQVNRILKREQSSEEPSGEEDEARDSDSLDDVKQQSKLLSAIKGFHRFEKIIGSSPPSPEVRESLLILKQKIESILGRE